MTISNCDGCQTTGGQLSCPTHGLKQYRISNTPTSEGIAFCSRHNEEFMCPKCLDDMTLEIDRIQYAKVK